MPRQLIILQDPLVRRAAAFARRCHKSQKRRTGEPYIIHPAEVAKTLARYTKDTHLIAAGWLHDVIEDCGKDYEDIAERFGTRVADYVAGASHDIRKPRVLRLKIHHQELGNALPEVKLLVAADMEHNARSVADTEFMERWYKKAAAKIPFIKKGNLGRYTSSINELITLTLERMAAFHRH